MKYWRKPGVRISAITYQGRASASIRIVPPIQGSARHCARPAGSSDQGSTAAATSTRANGPLDSRPIARPTKKP